MFQQTVLVPSIDLAPDVLVSYCYRAADAAVGGDFVDVLTVDGGAVLLAIGDVAGHGLAAASVMSEIRTAFRAASISLPEPCRIVERVDTYLAEFHRGTYATMLVVRFDPESGACTMACAGHVPPLAIGEGHDEIKWGLGEPPLGVRCPSRNETSFTLDHGQSLLLYTDGLVERRDESIDEGIDRLQRVVGGLDPSRPTLAEDTVEAMCGDTALKDDVATLSLHRRPHSDTIDVSRPAHVSELASLRSIFRRWLRSFAPDPQCLDDIVLAVCELVTNACLHAYSLAVTGKVSIHGEVHGRYVTFFVRDSGRWRDARPRGGGRGLKMVDGVVEQLSMDRSDEGTTVTLRARLDAPGQTEA
jgi:anti-sigma regulatory factor (Ser/Thr protein kinase)